MTKDDWAEGKRILAKIDETTARKKGIESLIKRMNEITGKYEREVEIQLAEQYMHTPKAKVSLSMFSVFLLSQIETVESEIESLWKEFEEI